MVFELPTFRRASFGFFPVVVELELEPALAGAAEEGGGGGMSEPSFTSCLTPFGEETVYIRIPMTHCGETSFPLHRDEFEPTAFKSEKRNTGDDEDT